MVTLSEPLDETAEMVPPVPVNCKTLLASFNTILLLLEKVPAPETSRVYAPILNAEPL